MIQSKLKNKLSLASILLIILSCFLLFSGTAGYVDGQIRRATAQVSVSVSKEIENEYAFGDVFAIPDCTFTKGGNSANGVASLQFPDGSETSKREVSLNQSGKYVLRYIATVADKVYTKEYSFTVRGRLASYSNSKTSMEYGFCSHLGSRTSGLMVQIANGDALAFDHVFNMSELSMATKLLEGFVVPTTQGSVDFAKMVFTFTDIEDPSVQLVYYGNFYEDSNAYGITYFTAAGNGQIQCGLEHVGRLHVGTNQGCMVPHSFMAMDTGLYWGAQKPTPTTPDAKKFCISYDAKTNQAWAGGKIISDLDDSNYYDSLWFGFPSGKAKLTISALNYNNATANICFTSILGVDLSAKNYVDEDAPVISVDNEYDVMPTAVVGGSYPVPTASALDQVNGACDVNVAVWHNYGMANQKMVNITNNRFKVNEVGTYAIVYEATDYSGNTAREVLWVRALSQAMEKLSISIDSEYNTNLTVGVMQTLPNVTVTGNSGNYTISYAIEKGRNSCEIKNGTFCLEEGGQWVLTCTVTDYVGNIAAAVFPLNGVISDKPIVAGEPNFPEAYVSEATYQLPTLYACDYSSGKKVEKLCDVSIAYNGNTKTYKAGDKFTPVVENNNDTLTISYICDGDVVWEKEMPVSVVFTKERIPGAAERYRDIVNVERYFYTQDDLTLTNHYELEKIYGMMVTAGKDMESGMATFINPQMANQFSVDFLTVPNASKFSQINVILTDSEDSNISVTASLIKAEGETMMVVGNTALSLTLDFDSATPTAYNLGFAGNNFVVNSTTTVAVSKMDNGETFNGFPSNKVYFSIEMCNAEAGASIFVTKICNINVDNKQDNTGPFIATTEEVETNAFKDSIYTVQKVLACDILCPNVTAQVTVIAPNGSPVTSVDGVLLQNADATVDHQIRLTEYGEYYISVVAKEASAWKYSNESYLDYLLTVVDGEAPKITFTKDFPTTLKVGDILEIPAYTVSDNFSTVENITVLKMIINPKGMPIYLYDINAITCEYAGEYRVCIYVYDQMGNLVTFETSVTVA